MRKKLIIAAAIIVLLLFAFIATLQYRQYSSYQVPVHAAAQTIVKINADDFIQLFVKNYGINFKKKIAKPVDKEREPSPNTGIWLPGNLFVYNLSSLRPGTFFCTLPLVNQQDFLLYAQKKWKLQWLQTDGIYYGSNAAGTVTVACNKVYISIAWSPGKEKVQSYLKEILGSKSMASQHAAVTARFKKEGQPIVAINDQGMATLKFKGDKLLLQAAADSVAGIHIPSSLQQSRHAPGTHSFLSLNARFFPTLFKKEYSIKQFGLATDSLLQYLKGSTYFSMGPGIVQKDSSTTYEYDDNFEKVEKVTVTDVQVPALQFSISAAPGLLQYLQQQQFVSADMELNREVFPLYRVMVQEGGAMLRFSTGEQQPLEAAASDHFLDLQIDIEKLVTQLRLSLLDAYVKNISTIKMQGNKQQGKLVIDGTILFKGNAFKQVVELIKTLK